MASRFREPGVFNPQHKLSGITGYTVLTAATAAALMHKKDYLTAFGDFTDLYRSLITGSHVENRLSFDRFQDWAAAYISPIAWTADVFDKVIQEAKRYAQSLGCSPETTRDAECVVGVIFKARTGYSKEDIAEYVADFYGRDGMPQPATRTKNLLQRCDCVQFALHAFLETEDFDSALQLAVSLGKGNGAVAVITGSVAEAYYKDTPYEFWKQCIDCLDEFLTEVLDGYWIDFTLCRGSLEVQLGEHVLLPGVPAEWKRWPVAMDVAFTFHETFGLYQALFDEYTKPTLYESAVKLFEGEDHDYIFPSYGALTVDIVPAFEWYVSWPLQRRGQSDGFTRRGKACGAQGWEGTYEKTLLRLWSRPTNYSNTSWCYLPSKGRMMLDVGGRTKEQAVDNWYRVAKPLRRILKEVRAQRKDKESEARILLDPRVKDLDPSETYYEAILNALDQFPELSVAEAREFMEAFA